MHVWTAANCAVASLAGSYSWYHIDRLDPSAMVSQNLSVMPNIFAVAVSYWTQNFVWMTTEHFWAWCCLEPKFAIINVQIVCHMEVSVAEWRHYGIMYKGVFILVSHFVPICCLFITNVSCVQVMCYLVFVNHCYSWIYIYFLISGALLPICKIMLRQILSWIVN